MTIPLNPLDRERKASIPFDPSEWVDIPPKVAKEPPVLPDVEKARRFSLALRELSRYWQLIPYDLDLN